MDTPFYLQKKDLPPEVMFTDIVNYLTKVLNLKAVTAPDSPDAPYSALYVDADDGKFKLKKSDGTVIIFEDIIVANDTKVRVKEEGTLKGIGSLNFIEDNDFDITWQSIDGENTIKIADNAIGNNHISTHTNDKITIANISQLPTVAPVSAEYIVKSLNGTLTAERELIAGTNITVDYSVANQAIISAPINTGGGAVDLTNVVKISGIITPATIGADQHNYAPTNIATKSIIRIEATVNNVQITGITPIANQVIILQNIGTTNTISLVSQSSSSTAANRFAFPANISLKPNGSVILWYDNTSTRWRAITVANDVAAGGSATAGSSIISRSVTESTFSNTTVVQTVFSHVFAAAELGTDKIYKLVVRGNYFNNSGSSRALTIELRFGTTTMWIDTIDSISSSSSRERPFHLEVYFHNKGVQNSQSVAGQIVLSDGSNPPTGFGPVSTHDIFAHGNISGVASETTSSASKALAVLMNHGTSSSSIIFKKTLAFIKEE